MKLSHEIIREANSDRYLFWRQAFAVPAVPPQPQWDTAMAQLGRFGVRIEPKGRIALKPDMTTAYHRVLRVPRGFFERPIEYQVLTLRHEIVHYRQRHDVGRHRFNARYLFRPPWRWAWEVQAYRQTVWTMRALGSDEAEVEEYAARLEFCSGYAIDLTPEQRRLTIDLVSRPAES